MTAILDAENVKSCHLIGTSAGCVHTAALAVGLPAERIRSVRKCIGLGATCTASRDASEILIACEFSSQTADRAR